MTHVFKDLHSAPACKLTEAGSKSSYRVLLHAAKNLSDHEFQDLEDDLSCFAETGLVGVQMSRLLVLLSSDIVADAA